MASENPFFREEKEVQDGGDVNSGRSGTSRVI